MDWTQNVHLALQWANIWTDEAKLNPSKTDGMDIGTMTIQLFVTDPLPITNNEEDDKVLLY